jgi:hypothetical protein
LEQYGQTVVPPKTNKPGRPRKPFKRWPRGAAYATVNKTYARGTVVATERKLVHGTQQDLARALAASPVSTQINTSFVERHNGTDRNYNARKVRQTYEFSKDLALHAALSWWVLFCYNFHHLHRSLRETLGDGTFLPRTPAMAIGLAQRPLTIADILSTAVVGFTPSSSPPPAALGLRPAVGPAP